MTAKNAFHVGGGGGYSPNLSMSEMSEEDSKLCDARQFQLLDDILPSEQFTELADAQSDFFAAGGRGLRDALLTIRPRARGNNSDSEFEDLHDQNTVTNEGFLQSDFGGAGPQMPFMTQLYEKMQHQASSTPPNFPDNQEQTTGGRGSSKKPLQTSESVMADSFHFWDWDPHTFNIESLLLPIKQETSFGDDRVFAWTEADELALMRTAEQLALYRMQHAPINNNKFESGEEEAACRMCECDHEPQSPSALYHQQQQSRRKEHVNRRPLTKQLSVPSVKVHCNFCYNNERAAAEKKGLQLDKDSKGSWSTHNCKDARGNVTCPYIRAYECTECHAKGAKAHTIRYCPQLKHKQQLMMERENARRLKMNENGNSGGKCALVPVADKGKGACGQGNPSSSTTDYCHDATPAIDNKGDVNLFDLCYKRWSDNE